MRLHFICSYIEMMSSCMLCDGKSFAFEFDNAFKGMLWQILHCIAGMIFFSLVVGFDISGVVYAQQRAMVVMVTLYTSRW